MLTRTVKELMTGVQSVDFVQPWYRCVRTNMDNTGMSLGGIGSAITATPAGDTPYFHFLNGCAIENSIEADSVQLLNYFYSEKETDDLGLNIRSASFFTQDSQAYPLHMSNGARFFKGDETVDEAGAILENIVNSPDFVKNNFKSLKEWGFLEDSYVTPNKLTSCNRIQKENYSILLKIFSLSVSKNVSFSRSLIADIHHDYRLNKPCYPSDKVVYEYLYPLSVTHYKEETQRCYIRKTHISLLSPGNDKLCSLPAYVTHFKIKNPSSKKMDFCLTLSVENIIGYDLIKSRPGVQDALFHFQKSMKGQTGRTFEHTYKNKQLKGMTLFQYDNEQRGDVNGSISIAANYDASRDLHLSVKPDYILADEANIIDAALATGSINLPDGSPIVLSGKEPRCGGICMSGSLAPEEEIDIEIITTLDFPYITNPSGTREKKYTQYFTEKNNRSETIVKYILENRDHLYNAEHIWRETTHNDSILNTHLLKNDTKTQLKQMVLDSYSFLPESSLWDSNNDFLIRECIDYPFFNSLDVYFYGSFGLLKILPEVDNEIIRKFSKTVVAEQASLKTFGDFTRFNPEAMDPSLRGNRLILGAVPHDMGSPFDDKPNAYTWKDVSYWLDLAPKFILLVYRNFLTTQDFDLLHECWGSVVAAIEHIDQGTTTINGLPSGSGCCNTFDNIQANGICIYSTSLWVAGLRTAAAIAGLLELKEQEFYYSNRARIAENELKICLWDEKEGRYIYSVMNLHNKHFISEKLQESLATESSEIISFLNELDSIGIHTSENTNPTSVVSDINVFINDDSAELPESIISILEANATDHLSQSFESINEFSSFTKINKRIVKKLGIYFSFKDLLIPDFLNEVVFADSDANFADQLCADMYLALLRLEPITPKHNQTRALNNILRLNWRGGPHRIGASNLVMRDGSDYDNFQAQDIWLGVQFSICGSLLDAEMVSEFETFFSAIYDAIYNKAKIPFGIPEGFNCGGVFIPEDLSRKGKIKHTDRERIIAHLKVIGILNVESKVNFTALQDIEDFEKFWSDNADDLDVLISANDLEELLVSTKLKYTAGRYFRSGMVALLPDKIKEITKNIKYQKISYLSNSLSEISLP